jgi:antitoxin component YwqK of YwqJK toxin-antitoxin module
MVLGGQWHENGKLKLEVMYENGKENGLWQQWYKSGQLRSSVKFINGIKMERRLLTTKMEAVRSKDIYLNGKVIK